MISYILILISIFADGIISNYINYTLPNLSLFLPNFTLISFIILYPIIKNKKSKFYGFTLIFTLIYDLLYTSIPLYTGFLYFILIIILDKIYNDNPFYAMLYIVIYNVINYITMFIIGIRYNPIYLLKIIYSSLLLNTLYYIILYIPIHSKYKVRKYINK